MSLSSNRLVPSSKFAEELASLPGGEIVETCLTCGICTATCIVSYSSDYNPRKVLQRVVLGARESVLQSEEPWLCTTCYHCVSECHSGVKLADLFALIRAVAIREGLSVRVDAQEISLGKISVLHNE